MADTTAERLAILDPAIQEAEMEVAAVMAAAVAAAAADPE
jgi:hypothetical protein